MEKNINQTMCLECGKNIDETKSIFCSIECACYSGTFNIIDGFNLELLKKYYKEKTGKDLEV